LPSQEASNLQILSGLQAQLQNEQDTLNTAKQQQVYLQTLIEQYRAVHATSRSADGTPLGLPGIDQELDGLKSKLADLSSRYTDHYPEVETLKEQIAETETVRAALIAKLNTKTKGGKQIDGTPTGNAMEPSQNSASLQLQGQLHANETEIASREQAIAALKERVRNYQDRLNSSPAREQELADLTRGYDQSKANYDELLKKQNESAMATKMEQMQQGERFTMLDPPSLPLKPDFPNRLKFGGIGIGVGFALAVIVVALFEVMDDRLHSEKEIKNLLPMAILSEIPEIVSPSDERSSKKSMALGWALAALIVVTILAGSTLSYLRG
jgi:polysaccharide biosynthesis transport protein